MAWNSLREHGPLGIPRGEAVGRLLKDLLAPEGFLVALRGIREVFDTGIGCEGIVESHRRARIFHVRRLPISSGHHVTHVLSWSEDVTDRRRAAEALAESERSHRRFVESLNERYFTEMTSMCGIIAIFAYRSSAAPNGRQGLEVITERIALLGADAEGTCISRHGRVVHVDLASWLRWTSARTGRRREKRGWVPALVEVPDTSA